MVDGDMVKGRFVGDVGGVRREYNRVIMEFPLSVEEVWDLEFGIRDELECKGFGLVNFCNFPLVVDGVFVGYFNSIDGDRVKIRRLFSVLCEFFDCFYRVDSEKLSVGYIVFPLNVTCEVFYVLDKVVCGF